MYNSAFWLSKNPVLDILLKGLLGAALFCGLAPHIFLQGTTLPITLGSLLACLIPALIGWRAGGLAVFLYLICGVIGLPVFAGYDGGINYFITAHKSTGFLYGFLVAALIVGLLSENTQPIQILRMALIYFIGQAIILACGFLHMSRLPDFDFNILATLKNVGPGLLVKGGLFLLVIQLLNRKLP